MLGYIKNKSSLYHINSIDRQLQDAISFSGGTQQHYNLFQNIMTYSLWNKTVNIPLHDTRAAQALLFLYPIKVQVFLSLILYKQEILIRDSFTSLYEIEENIVTPETMLLYNSTVTKNLISLEIRQLFDFINENVILNDDNLKTLTDYFSVNKSVNSLDTNMSQAISNLFNLFNIRNSNNESFITLALDNNRVRAVDTLARYLNYKQRSRNILSQTVNQWQHQTSST